MAFQVFLNRIGRQWQACNNIRSQYAWFSTRFESIKSNKSMKIAAAAVCCLGMSGGVYGYLTSVPERKRNIATEITELALAEYYKPAQLPTIKPSRQISGPATDFGLNLEIFQYQSCPFCCKVRAFLEYYGIPYNVIEVHPVLRKQLSFSEYKKVPVVITKDKKSHIEHQLNDSSVIISVLSTLMLNMHESLENVLNSYKPVKYQNGDGKEVIEVMNRYFLMHGEDNDDSKKEEISKEMQWRQWVDQEFVHLLSPNIFRTSDEALHSFKYFSKVGEWEKNFSKWECLLGVYVGAIGMYFVGKRLKKKYSLKEDVRESFYDSCKYWMKNVGKSKFMGGENPNLADLAVYGVLSSIEGCLAFQDLVKNTSIGPWYYRMKDDVKSHAGYKLIYEQ